MLFLYSHANVSVKDMRILFAESSGTNGTAMTVQYARLTVVRNLKNLEDWFQYIWIRKWNTNYYGQSPTCRIALHD